MHKKEDERQVVSTSDIQKTLRTQLNFRFFVVVLGFFVACFLIPMSVMVWIEVAASRSLGFIAMAILVTLADFMVVGYTVNELVWFIKEHIIISKCQFEVIVDTVERLGPEENERIPMFTMTRYRDVFWNSGDAMAQRQGSAISSYLGRRFTYPIYFTKSDRAIYDTFKWKEYLREGSECILVIYDKAHYNGDCNIVRIYPSLMYKYKE